MIDDQQVLSELEAMVSLPNVLIDIDPLTTWYVMLTLQGALKTIELTPDIHERLTAVIRGLQQAIASSPALWQIVEDGWQKGDHS